MLISHSNCYMVFVQGDAPLGSARKDTNNEGVPCVLLGGSYIWKEYKHRELRREVIVCMFF